MNAAQIKKEKKLVEEKVEKVRQVVPTVSKNDIILALHNFDMDVQRTIQAFCEEGKQGALGEWESTGKSKKSKKSVKTETSAPAEVSVPKPQTKQNGYSNNGFSSGPITATSSSALKTQNPPKAKKNSNLENITHSAKQNKPSNTETSQSNQNLSEPQKLFDRELRNAEHSIVGCFNEIREAIAKREHQLLVSLNQVRSDGMSQLTNQKVTGRQLQDLIHTTRFVHSDNSKLIHLIGQFGEVVSINGDVPQPQPEPVISTTNSNPVIKHATSHSSIVSSVGEDSGLGQISPVSNGKNLSVVENGGIAMQSQGLSTDQLAEIQRQVAESLKAQGIDPSVLASGAPVAPRRRPQKEQTGKKPIQKGGNKKNQKDSQIELSVHN